jgi:hypothetical protein
MNHTAKNMIVCIAIGAILGMLLTACQAPKKVQYEDPTKTYNVISVSQFIKTDTNNLGGVIDQNLAYYITYADADGSVGNISLVPDRYHTIQVSTDGTNTVTITPAGAQNETVKLVVTQDMLEKSGGQLQNSPSK